MASAATTRSYRALAFLACWVKFELGGLTGLCSSGTLTITNPVAVKACLDSNSIQCLKNDEAAQLSIYGPIIRIRAR